MKKSSSTDESINNDKNNLYPIFLKLEQMRLLIVGGGNVALEKLQSVLNNSPRTTIKIIAPNVCHDIKEICYANSSVNYEERKITPSDMDYGNIIIVATNDMTVNEWVCLQAKVKGKLVNVADTPALCDFYLGSIVNKGHLKIAISTNGKSPTMAKRFKEILNNAIPNTDDLLTKMYLIRSKLKGNLTDKMKKLNEITSVLEA
jgi:siroheme synthase-like protein